MRDRVRGRSVGQVVGRSIYREDGPRPRGDLGHPRDDGGGALRARERVRNLAFHPEFFEKILSRVFLEGLSGTKKASVRLDQSTQPQPPPTPIMGNEGRGKKEGTNPHMIEDGTPEMEEVAMVDVHAVEAAPSVVPGPSAAGYFGGSQLLGGSVGGGVVLEDELVPGGGRPGDTVAV